MNPGYMRSRVTLYQPVNTRAANGEQLTAMQSVGVRWGSIKAESGGEGQVAGMQVQAIQQWVVKIRYEPALVSIAPDWELCVDGRTFRVISIDNVLGLRRELVIRATEVVK